MPNSEQPPRALEGCARGFSGFHATAQGYSAFLLAVNPPYPPSTRPPERGSARHIARLDRTSGAGAGGPAQSETTGAVIERLVREHDGEVPDTMEELLRLPGVARKTANVVLGTHFGIAVGIVVDTHVGRLARRLGLTREQNPVAVERDLTAQVPQDDWVWISHALIWHGRLVCDARRPKCVPVCAAAST